MAEDEGAAGWMGTIGKVADAISKLGLPKIAAAIAFAAGGLLWLPDKWLTKAKVLPFRNAHAELIAPAFWLAAIFTVLCFVPWLIGSMRGKPSKRKRRQHVLERLNKLTKDEMACLGEFIRKDSRTVQLPSEHPTVMALFNTGLIWRPPQTYYPRPNYSNNATMPLTHPMMYHINETAWEILQEQVAKRELEEPQ